MTSQRQRVRIFRQEIHRGLSLFWKSSPTARRSDAAFSDDAGHQARRRDIEGRIRYRRLMPARTSAAALCRDRADFVVVAFFDHDFIASEIESPVIVGEGTQA